MCLFHEQCVQVIRSHDWSILATDHFYNPGWDQSLLPEGVIVQAFSTEGCHRSISQGIDRVKGTKCVSEKYEISVPSSFVKIY